MSLIKSKNGVDIDQSMIVLEKVRMNTANIGGRIKNRI
jgi:hypothetical protein